MNAWKTDSGVQFFFSHCTDFMFKEKTGASFLLAEEFANVSPQLPSAFFYTVTNKALLRLSPLAAVFHAK